MSEKDIINQIGKEINAEFIEVPDKRSIFLDFGEKECTYCLDSSDNIIGLKIKGLDLEQIPTDIAKLKSLSVLNLSKNKITDISVLRKNLMLTAVNLDDNKITKLEPLENLMVLKWLNLQFNEITDISPLYKLKSLLKLYLDKNSISNVSGISRLNNLKEFSLNSNKLKDIKPLTFCEKLTKLELSDNNISDIFDIVKLLNLRELNISNNKIKSLPDLSFLKNLETLLILNNQINSTKYFEGLSCFTNANGNPLKDVYIFTEPQQGVINVDGLSEITANIIDQIISEKGSMVGIFGKWGRGKSFFWKELRKKMELRNYEIVEFLAWKYHDTPASWAYLYEAFAKTYYKKPDKLFSVKWIFYFLKIIISNFRQEPILNIIRILTVTLVPFFVYFVLINSSIKKTIDIVGVAEFSAGFWGTYIFVLSYYFSKIYSINVSNIFKRISAKKYENLLGLQATIEKDFAFLTKIWNKKIILFVDDLDRCSEDNILKIIDSLRIMTENKIISEKVIVVAAVDERILKRVIKNKYKGMVEGDKIIVDSLTREYLDKLFLFGLKLPALNNDEKIEIFDNYTFYIQVLFGTLTAYETNSNTEYIEGQRVYREDFTFIRKYLKLVSDITPRQIRIIYNKYVLANEIMKLKTGLQEMTTEQKEFIIAMIMWFSIEKKIDEMSDFETGLLNNDEIFERTMFGKEFKTTGIMWNKYLEVIRTAVPY